jgi:hypothetical protein
MKKFSLLFLCFLALTAVGCASLCFVDPVFCPDPKPTPTPTPPPVEDCRTLGCEEGFSCKKVSAGPNPQYYCVADPTPEPPACPYLVPTARQLRNYGYRVEINPKKEGRNVGFVNRAYWPSVEGWPYYCQEGMWPERCEQILNGDHGKKFGPVVPDGTPKAIEDACNAVFLEQPCPTFRMAECTGTGGQCPITFDPFYMQGDPPVNQNHPRNVRPPACPEDYIKDADGHPLEGQWRIASAHGKGRVEACSFGEEDNPPVCTTSKFQVNN